MVEFDLIAFHMLLREFTDHIYDPVSPLVFWGNPRLAKIDGVNAWQAGRVIVLMLQFLFWTFSVCNHAFLPLRVYKL